jgi:hypothetical protein
MQMEGIALAVRWAALLEGDPRWLVALAFGLGAGVFLFVRGFSAWRHMRLVEDTPTSRVRSMALGRVEVRGRAEGKGPLAAPLTGRSCVWYRWRIEEEVGDSRHRRWRTLEQGSSDAWPFYVEDETGQVLVDPQGANIDAPHDLSRVNPDLTGPLGSFVEERGIRTSGFLGMRRKLRFTEWHIAPGDALYVLGVAQERGGIVHERRSRITEKLALLRADPDAMAAFDRDGDGHVSGDEWDVARRLAVQEVELGGFEDRVVIARDPDGRAPFYVSDRDERAVIRSHRWSAVGGVFGGAALALCCVAALLHKLELL